MRHGPIEGQLTNRKPRLCAPDFVSKSGAHGIRKLTIRSHFLAAWREISDKEKSDKEKLPANCRGLSERSV